jgi:hypothetical protein
VFSRAISYHKVKLCAKREDEILLTAGPKQKPLGFPGTFSRVATPEAHTNSRLKLNRPPTPSS